MLMWPVLPMFRRNVLAPASGSKCIKMYMFWSSRPTGKDEGRCPVQANGENYYQNDPFRAIQIIIISSAPSFTKQSPIQALENVSYRRFSGSFDDWKGRYDNISFSALPIGLGQAPAPLPLLNLLVLLTLYYLRNVGKFSRTHKVQRQKGRLNINNERPWHSEISNLQACHKKPERYRLNGVSLC
jgi:hypothetical protein